jgi:hypothetical protein
MQASIFRSKLRGMTERIKIYHLLLVLLIGLATCQKEKIATKEYPRVNTLEVTSINDDGAIFSAEIISGDITDVIEYGFVWDISASPNVEISDKLVITEPLNGNIFNVEIHSALTKGETYYIKPFVKTKEFLVYGKVVEFISLGSEAPIIKSFTPQAGTWGDTIKISGKNFRYKMNGNLVKIGTVESPVISSTDTTILIRVPEIRNTETAKLSVTVVGNSAISSSLFTYLVPKITSVFPGNVTFNDTVFIRGNNLTNKKNQVRVRFNETDINIAYATENLIKVVVPDSYYDKVSSVSVLGTSGFVKATSSLVLKDLVIKSCTPDTIFKPLSTITIQGENFNPVVNNNEVFIGGYKAIILEGTTQQLKVQLPNDLIPYRDISVLKSAEVRVKTGELNVIPSKKLEICWKSTWTKKKNFSGKMIIRGVGFAINKKGYIGLGFGYSGSSQEIYNRDFWEYNPKTDSWTPKAAFPGEDRINTTNIVMNNEGYVGLGNMNYPIKNFNDTYKYNPVTDSWTRIADYSGQGRGLALSFVWNGNLYVGGGNVRDQFSTGGLDDWWSYDPQTDKWIQKQNCSDYTYGKGIVSIGENVYKFSYSPQVMQFDGSEWIEVANAIFSSHGEFNYVQQFSMGGRGYLFKDDRNGISVFEFDPSTGNSSLFKLPAPVSPYEPTIFSVDGKAYFVGGREYTEDATSSVWEFDPTLPKD